MVFDKLRRIGVDGCLLIDDVICMYDFVGCWIIFESFDELYLFCKYMYFKDVMCNVRYELCYDDSKYDYIVKFKLLGY